MRDAERGTFEDEGEEIADINKTQDFDSQQRSSHEHTGFSVDTTWAMATAYAMDTA